LKLLTYLFLLAASVAAQTPRIGIIDFFGRRTVSESTLRAALGVKEGDELPPSKGNVEEALEQVPNVVNARLEAACCEDGKAVLYVGIEERGAPHFNYLNPPSKPVLMPDEVHDEYVLFLADVGAAARGGNTSEDLSQGHSLLSDEKVRKRQLKFVEFADAHLPKLREVLRESIDEEHRAIAAYVIGYAPKKADVVGDLQHALRDPDDTVRNNAMRSLGAIAVLAMRQPDLEIKVSPTWFIEMLDSLIWMDRNTAAASLVTLTEKRDKAVLDHLRERAVPSLVEMARWKHLPHALPAFILLGRIAGMQETEIQDAWAKGDRESVIRKVLPKPAK
jgi:hypothetical protein